jgi:hypothetical protein
VKLPAFDVPSVFRSLVAALPTAWRGSARKPFNIAAIVFLLGSSSAWSFDYARYQPADLDTVMAQARPRSGFDAYRARPLKLKVTLASYSQSCLTSLLNKAMITGGIPKEQVEALHVTACIKVRSAKGRELPVFIQDVVAGFLPREVPLGSQLTLWAIHVFTSAAGPGLLVNEFSTDADNNPAKSESSSEPAAKATAPTCGCGTADFHPGADIANDTAGAPVQAVDDGVVVKVEEDEQASVDAPNIGRCGRYVVVKHSYPNGQTAFSRYAQLGRIVGGDGRPIVSGARVKRSDKIGEIGSSKILHFEIRPVAPGTMEQDAGRTARYGADPAMEWSRYQAVDPQSFDVDAFGGKGAGRK